MDFNFTAKIEDEFDEIAAGKLLWSDMIDSFYKPFHITIEHTLETTQASIFWKDLKGIYLQM